MYQRMNPYEGEKRLLVTWVSASGQKSLLIVGPADTSTDESGCMMATKASLFVRTRVPAAAETRGRVR